MSDVESLNQTVTLCGYSDDLIEIEGALSEEFSYPGEASIVGFSDGTVLSIEYASDGCWRIHLCARGSALLDIVPAVAEDDHNYSDRATLTGAPGVLRWAVVGTGWTHPS